MLSGANARWVLLGLLVSCVVLDLLFYTGFYASDDNDYVECISAIAEGEPLPNRLRCRRLAFVLLPALALRLTDSFPIAVLTVSFFHTVLVGITYAVGNRIHGSATGLVAAAIVVFSSIAYVYAGALLPDLCLAVCVGFSLYALVVGLSAGKAGWGRRLPLIVCGLFIGIGYSAKESSVIFTVPVALTVITTLGFRNVRAWVSDGLWILSGLVFALLIEAALVRYFFGEWSIRLAVLFGGRTDHYLETAARQGGLNPISRLAFGWRVFSSFFGVWLWGILAILVYPFIRSASWAPWFFFSFSALFMTVGSVLLTEYRPPPIQLRYYLPLLLPGAVMVAGVWSSGSQWAVAHLRGRWKLIPTAVGVLLLLGFSSANLSRSWSDAGEIYGGSLVWAYQDAHRWAELNQPGRPIFLSPYLGRRMRGFNQATGLDLGSASSGEATAELSPSGLYFGVLNIENSRTHRRKALSTDFDRSRVAFVAYPRKKRWSAIQELDIPLLKNFRREAPRDYAHGVYVLSLNSSESPLVGDPSRLLLSSARDPFYFRIAGAPSTEIRYEQGRPRIIWRFSQPGPSRVIIFRGSKYALAEEDYKIPAEFSGEGILVQSEISRGFSEVAAVLRFYTIEEGRVEPERHEVPFQGVGAGTLLRAEMEIPPGQYLGFSVELLLSSESNGAASVGLEKLEVRSVPRRISVSGREP